MSRPFMDITGERFDRLVAVERIETARRSRWLCQCDCGAITSAYASNLRSGVVRSCGCLRNEVASKLTRARFLAARGMANARRRAKRVAL